MDLAPRPVNTDRGIDSAMSCATVSHNDQSATRVGSFVSQRTLGTWRQRASESDAAMQRARRMLTLDIEFVPSGTFSASRQVSPPPERPPTGWLTADEEIRLFRWMNFAKYRASVLRTMLVPHDPSESLMDEIDDRLASSIEVRNRLVQVFINLSYAIARGFGHRGHLLEELESEANSTLLRAMERFDADRGFRFSTYATHAIRRNLCRYLKKRRKRMSRELAVSQIEGVVDQRRWSTTYERWMSKTTSTLSRMIGHLEPREQLIIRARFGLGDDPRVQTLQSLADTLQLSRERVRQLERRAIQHLRELASEIKLEEPDS